MGNRNINHSRIGSVRLGTNGNLYSSFLTHGESHEKENSDWKHARGPDAVWPVWKEYRASHDSMRITGSMTPVSRIY